MARNSFLFTLVLSLALSLGLAGALEAQPIALQDSIRVNASRQENRSNPALAADSSGNLVVVWRGGFTSTPAVVRGQRLDRSGLKLGGQLQMPASAAAQSSPSVGMADGGSFVVAWSEQERVLAQRFDSEGIPQGSVLTVDADTGTFFPLPSVGMGADGRFVVTWRSETEILARAYAADGSPVASEIQVPTTTGVNPGGQRVALDGAGRFVVVWIDRLEIGSPLRVRGRLFDASSSPEGAEFQINTSPNSGAADPDVSRNAAGDFVVAWRESEVGDSTTRIRARAFDENGIARGGELAISSLPAPTQILPKVGLDEDSNFVVSWVSTGQGEIDVRIRRFRADGSALEEEFEPPEVVPGAFNFPDVAVSDNGRFAVLWLFGRPQDGAFSSGLFVQRYCQPDLAPFEDADVDGVADVCDNCPQDANGDQLDSDRDDVGDLCDLCLGNDTTGDSDQDGLCANRDCDDSDGGNACRVFDDSFERGTLGAWSSSTGT